MQEFENMPAWKKAIIVLFVFLMPFIGSFNGIAY